MPAGLPGSQGIRLDPTQPYLNNPSAGNRVFFDLLSGPRGSPFDYDKFNTPNSVPTPAQNNSCSTGALSTGIGFGSPPIIGLTAPASIQAAGFSDDYTVGVTLPDGTDSPDSTIMYIGGGRCDPPPENGDGVAQPNPYTEGFGIGGGGQGGSRDAGSAPAFTGFLNKMVTATGAVANGVAIEAGWINRSGIGMTTGQSAFGSSDTASDAPA